MRRLALSVVVIGTVVAAATALASTGGSSGGVSTSRPTYYENVRPILEGRCTGCHYSGGIAPFALKRYSQAFQHRKQIAYMVSHRLMPPWRADKGYRKYLYDSSLTNAQIRTVVRWVAQGAPKGSSRHAGRLLPRTGLPRMSHVDVTQTMPGPYLPQGVDDYRCFVLPWTPDRPVYVTGIDLRPGQRAEVHHVSILIFNAAETRAAEALDAADAGPGFGCSLGMAAPTQYPYQLLGGWAPGGYGGALPQGTGVKVPAGSHLVVQIHYHNPNRAPKPDLSRLDLQLADSVARPSTWLSILNPNWLTAPDRFEIPAGKKDVRFTFTGDPRKNLAFVPGELDLSNGFVVHAAALHMHMLGTGGKLVIEHAGGSTEPLLSISRWNFMWQFGYQFASPATFGKDDQLMLQCRWDNSAANQPVMDGVQQRPKLVRWGERSTDEMCVGYLYVSEK